MREYIFADRSQMSKTPSRHFGRHSEALAFVRSEATRASALAELRHWANRRHRGVLSDRRLFEYAAMGLVTGQLVVKSLLEKEEIKDGEAKPRSNAGLKPSQTARPLRKPAGPKPPEEIRVRKQAPKPAAPKTAPVDIDQQIAVLKAAAQNGAPFCEQCERSRLEAEQAQ